MYIIKPKKPAHSVGKTQNHEH